ncbi:MAG: response regulator [Chitinophagaceae bacterium]|jgi:CheY-like chemotaxis protein|nr:response regulator [Chitinophagaceae bacterium]
MFKKVLIVNDDEITQFVSIRLMQKTKFASDIACVSNGAQALAWFDALLKQGKAFPGDVPELVFLDLHMPVMDGMEFLEIFSAKYAYIYPSVRFVILSASIDPQDTITVEQNPLVMDVIRHPVSYEVLELVKQLYYRSQIGLSHTPPQVAPWNQLIA